MGKATSVRIQDKLNNKKVSVVPSISDPTKNGLVIVGPDGKSVGKRENDGLTHIKPKDGKKVNAEYINGLKTWTDFATRRTAEPTVQATETDYTVFEYTYGTTKYYRTVYNTYSPATDIFYSEDTLENIIATRALSI